MDPTRFVDTRINSGATRLIGRVPKKIPFGGRQGHPGQRDAISANFTVVNPSGAGYLTLWDCSNPMPTVSSLNFAAGETVANAVTVPLDAGGNLCVYSPVRHGRPRRRQRLLPRFGVVEVRRYRAGAGDGHRAASARRCDWLRGQTVELTWPSQPANADAAVLNVTTVAPELDGYVTVYPARPSAPTRRASTWPRPRSPQHGRSSPVATTAPSPLRPRQRGRHRRRARVHDHLERHGLRASEPFRLTDHRDRYRTEVNAGTNGNRVGAGQNARCCRSPAPAASRDRPSRCR